MTLLAALAVSIGVALVLPSVAVERLRLLAHERSARSWRDRLARLPFGPWARRAREQRRAAVLQALTALAAELHAGQPPTRALVSAAGQPCAWPAAVSAARVGSDVAAALRIDAADHDESALVSLATLWQVAARHGTGLADAVAVLADTSRREQDVRSQLDAHLAGPRATARVLSVLPLVGVAFGLLLGADPLAWLLGTRAGELCAVVGIALTVAGMAWTSRIAAGVGHLM